MDTTKQAVKYIWRGPFAVVKDGRTRWKIVNAHGEVERLGYNYRGAADEECRLKNLAQSDCEAQVEPPECICDGGEQGDGLVAIPHEAHCPLAVPCPTYRPDHNGECLNCDEPASEHDVQAIVEEGMDDPTKPPFPATKHRCNLCELDCGGCSAPAYQCNWLVTHQHRAP